MVGKGLQGTGDMLSKASLGWHERKSCIAMGFAIMLSIHTYKNTLNEIIRSEMRAKQTVQYNPFPGVAEPVFVRTNEAVFERCAETEGNFLILFL